MSSKSISGRTCLSVAVAIGTIIVAPTALAVCKLQNYADGSPFIPQDVVIDMGRLVIPPDLGVGGVIKESRWWLNKRNAVIYCNGGGQAFDTYLRSTQKNPAPGFMDVFPTDVAGVGIRVTSTILGDKRILPITQNLPSYFVGRGSLAIGDGELHVELIRTAEQTGAGLIAPLGRFTAYYLDEDGVGRPIQMSSFRGPGTVIVRASCSVKTKDIRVNLGKVPNATFAGVGSRSISRDFEINLRCQGDDGGAEALRTMVTVRLDDVAGNSADGGGVLKLSAGADTAKGIGIQIMQRKDAVEAPVELGKPIEVGRLALAGSELTLPLRAHYIQTLPGAVEPGKANGQATFTIDYQ